MRGVILRLCLLAVGVLFFSVSSHAEVVPLFESEAEPVRPEGWDEWVNRAASFHVWQNDSVFRDHYVRTLPDGSGVTALCVPAAIGNALLREYSRVEPRVSGLRIPGLIENGSKVETTETLRGIGERCGIGGLKGIFEPWTTAQCIRDIFFESGYSHSRVKLIRNYDSREESPGIVYEERAPTLRDVVEAVREGYQVIASIAFLKRDSTRSKWTKVSGHSVNIVGYGRADSRQSQRITIYIQNPTRQYDVDHLNPVFDEVTLTEHPELHAEGLNYSNLKLEGPPESLISLPGLTPVLAGLILLNADPASLQGIK